MALGLLVVVGLGLTLIGLGRLNFQSAGPASDEPNGVPLASTQARAVPAVSRPALSPRVANPVTAIVPSVAPVVTGFHPGQTRQPDWNESVLVTHSRAAIHFDRNSNYFADDSLRRALAAARRDDLAARSRPGRSELERLIAELDAFIDTFEAGDLPSRVMQVQGLPDEMTLRMWRYGSSLVFFKNGYVDHWSDGQPRLRVRPRVNLPFTDWPATAGR